MLNVLTRHARAEDILKLFNQYVKNAGMEMTRTLLKYIYSNAKISDMNEFADFIGQIRPELEETVMTAEQQAVLRGKQTAVREIILRMLSIGDIPSKVAKSCNVPLSMVLKLKENNAEIA